jgi:hypothetical protein
MSKLTQARLKQLLHYSPDTGEFIRLVPTVGKVGDKAGSLASDGYVYLCVDNKRYLAHRLAFLWVTGQWPVEFVDHVNQDRSDNRWVNLREATNAQNQHNTKLFSSNTSGVKGVCWHKGAKKWIARIRADGRRINLGLFDTVEEAKAAREAVEVLARGQ